jgi:hypothetical protein
MSWLSTLLGYGPKSERTGISLDRKAAYWVIKGFRDFPAFLKSLGNLFPSGAVLYVEGTSIARDVQDFLRSKCPEKTTKVGMGTIWPRPQTFHMALTPENVSGLAKLAQQHALPEVCDHLHVYKENQVLLEAHDIADQCVSLSGNFSADRMKQLCAELGSQYKKGDGGCFCSPGKY